jgi:MFS family permease
VLIGIFFVLLGAVVLAAFTLTPMLVVVAVSCFVIGIGLGLVAPPSLIAAQSSVEWNERGVVTGTNMFARSMGSAVGVAIFGAVANAILGSSAAAHNSPHAVEGATLSVFIAVVIAAAATGVAALAMPRDRHDVVLASPPEPMETTV